MDTLDESHLAGQPVGPNVPLSSLHFSMSHDRFDRGSVVACQRQPSTKRRPQIVPFQIANFCSLASSGKRSLDIQVGFFRRRFDENVFVRFLLSVEHQKNWFNSFVQHVHRYLSVSLSLCSIGNHHIAEKVDLVATFNCSRFQFKRAVKNATERYLKAAEPLSNHSKSRPTSRQLRTESCVSL